MTVSQRESRNDQIDTLRAIACVGLVAFHVVGDSPSSGLELSSTHWLVEFNKSLVDLRMPLFSFLSGMVFPPITGSALRRISSKARRLLLPMATVGTFFWILRYIMGYEQVSLVEIYFKPYVHFWFLQATFLIMTSFTIGAFLFKGKDKFVILMLGLIGGVLYISSLRLGIDIFSVMRAWHLVPFFAAGFLIANGPNWNPSKVHRAAASAGLVICLMLGGLLAADVIYLSAEPRRAVSVGLGLAFCILLKIVGPNSRGMAVLGRHSYAIYLFHVFFLAAMTMALKRMAPDTPVVVLFGAGLLAGLIGPIVTGKIIMLHPVSALLFLGIRKKKP